MWNKKLIPYDMKFAQIGILIFTGVIIMASFSCKKESPILNNIPNAAYVRIFTDYNIAATALTSVNDFRRYLYINSKFDSLSAIPLNSVQSSDADIYNRDPELSPGNENYIFFNDSYYSFGSIALAGLDNAPYYNYYPDYFNRVQVAPIIGKFDFYKWAQVPPGALRITFTSKQITGGQLNNLVIDTVVQVKKGQIYSYLLTLAADNVHYRLLQINENPESANFAPGQGYLRLVNVSPDNAGIPQDLDVYLFVRRTDAPRPPVVVFNTNRDTIINQEYIGSVTGSFNANSSFIKLPTLPDTAFFRDNILRLDDELPVYILEFYKKGDIPSPSNIPLFALVSDYGPKKFNFFMEDPYGDQPLLTKYGTCKFKYPIVFDLLGGIHPTYNTFLFGVRKGGADQQFQPIVGLTRYVWEPGDASDGFRR